MLSIPFQTLQIGMIGSSALLRYNMMQLKEAQKRSVLLSNIQISMFPIYSEVQVAQLDGLLITGWQYPQIFRKLYPLYHSISDRLEELSLWGIASGAAFMGRNGIFPVIDCAIHSDSGQAVTTSLLELPDDMATRFVGYFIPEVQFSALAPNLGILCQNQTHGVIAVRQGNHLASSFVAEFTPQCALYSYWLEMVARLKEWKI